MVGTYIRSILCLMLVAAVGLSSLPHAFTGEAHASTPGQPSIGVYTGPADTVEHDQFSAWLGNEATYAVDFVDDSQTWNNIANYSDWLIDPWSAWVKAKDGRRMVVSVPLLNQDSSGKLVEGANGAYDQHFRTLAQEMVDDGLGNAVIRLGWEANGDWYPWKASTNPEAWKAYYRRIVGVMRSVQPVDPGQPPQNFSFDLTYNRGNSGTAIKFDTMYPGDDVVDIIGMDVYDTKWMDNTSAPEARWDEVLNQEMGLNEFKVFATLHGKPMSIPEWGLWEKDHDDNGGVGDNPYFIDRMADWLESNAGSVVYQSYFNHLSGWTGDHRLSTYSNAQSRYRTRFGLPVPNADTVPPTVSLTAPRNKALVFRTTKVSATASDSGGVAGVQFKLNGSNLGAEDRYSPFDLSWDTTQVPNGTYTVTAVAHDVAGNISTSSSRTVTVRNR